MTEQSKNVVRLDKWLWAARFFKTRSICQHEIELGRVYLNEQRCKASRTVKVGDILRIERSDEIWTVRVIALSEVRRGATRAQLLYEETRESQQKRQAQRMLRKFANEPALSIDKGRPTKRDGRYLRRVKESWGDWE